MPFEKNIKEEEDEKRKKASDILSSILPKEKGNAHWVKGESGNPKGRPKGTKNKFCLSDLKAAMEKAAEKHGGETLLESICDRAYTNDQLAIAVLRKLLPDLKGITADVELKPIGYASMTPSEAAEEMDKATAGEKEKDKE